MKKHKYLMIVAALFFQCSLFGQISGNQVYKNIRGNSSEYGYEKAPKGVNTITTTDSTLIINASILMNSQADFYLVSLAMNQEAATVVACNDLISKRLNQLENDLKILGVEKEDLYIDFISQTKVYDYEVSKSQAVQVEAGFEIKKNIIVRISDLALIDKLIEIAAKQEIYDLIKVEYVNEDVDKTYQKMFTEALAFINSRKTMYLSVGNLKLTGDFRIASDHFYSVYPKTQYQMYQAFEASDLNVYSNRYSGEYIRKEARKNKTFYYQGLDVSDFDKIINPTTPEVGIQYVLNISIIYKINRSTSTK